jgi:hypothetical protein
MKRNGQFNCPFCRADELDGPLTYCRAHSAIFTTGGQLLFGYDISSRLASLLDDCDATNGVIRLRPSTVHTGLLDGERLRIADHEDLALRHIYENLIQQLYRQIATFDCALDNLFLSASIARLNSAPNEPSKPDAEQSRTLEEEHPMQAAAD